MRRTILLMVCLIAMLAAPGARASSHNLLPNAGFEQSAFEPAPVPQGTLSPQPLLPTGWAFEGTAALFDHWEGGDLRSVKEGERAIAISDPVSMREEVCPDPAVGCHDNPVYPPLIGARTYVSQSPAWRTLTPITLPAKRTYTLSVWNELEFGAPGFGAITMVRWLDANQVPIGLSNGPSRKTVGLLDAWRLISGSVTAPAAARYAIVLLGSDDLSIGQVRYDQAFFG